MDLINKPQEEDLPSPKPWERHPISEARWRKHRDTMMRWAYPGSRPQEWWLYERNMQQPDQPSVWLYDHGELSGTELDVLLPHWRGKYEHSWQPNFCYNAGGSRGWLEGAAAGKAWCRLFGIPPTLTKQWNEERRRSAKVVQQLKSVASL